MPETCIARPRSESHWLSLGRAKIKPDLTKSLGSTQEMVGEVLTYAPIGSEQRSQRNQYIRKGKGAAAQTTDSGCHTPNKNLKVTEKKYFSLFHVSMLHVCLLNMENRRFSAPK